MMLEQLKKNHTHHLTGEHIQTIGRSLFYKRKGLILGGKGEGEPNGYDTVRTRIRFQVNEADWEADATFPVTFSRRDLRLTYRALRFAARNPSLVAEHALMQADTPAIDNADSGLGIPAEKADEVFAEQRSYAVQLSLAAMATRSAMSAGHTKTQPVLVHEPLVSAA